MHEPTLGSRALFPTLDVDVYVNHAAISPPSAAVRDAVITTLDGYGRQGVAQFPVEMARRDRVRHALARLMGAEAVDVALIPNTSAGMTDIALCLPWQRGDRILLFRGEFPANVTPWQRAAAVHGLEIVWLDAEDFRLDRAAALADFEAALRRGIRLVAVSQVQFATGQHMPIGVFGALCAEFGAELFVDAIQGLGVVPIDVQTAGVHYLSAGGHKWLMGSEGTGVLYVAPESAAALRPNVASCLSHDEPFSFLFEGPGLLRYDRPIVQRAGMVEGGSANVLGIAALEASVGLLREIGIDAIYDHVQAWHDAMEPLLVARGFVSARMTDPAGRSGTLSLQPPGHAGAPAWWAALAGHGISCACPDGWLRLAPHWPNALDEPQRIAAAVDAILATGGPRAEIQAP